MASSTIGASNVSITAAQLAQQPNWIVVDNHVLDIAKFASIHPGGAHVFANFRAGANDATAAFFALHTTDVLRKYIPRLRVGVLEGAQANDAPSSRDFVNPVGLAPSERPGYATSPYYNASHAAFRKVVRKFTQTEIRDEALANDVTGKAPSSEMFEKLGAHGYLALRLGPSPVLAAVYPGPLPGGIKASEYDYFHELIVAEELATLGTPGYADGIGGGLSIGLPPVAMFGTDALRRKVLPEVLSGKKKICLAISEAGAGSDVANIGCKAELSEDGRHFVVTGAKKWITNGMFADYFTTAVRTSGPGMGGITLLLIERSEGVSTRLIKSMYSSSAGTAYVLFDHVRVPVENVLGKVGQGFKCIMFNFNHERWVMCATIVAYSRVLLDEAMRWAFVRKVFGKALIEQPVIREKLANMTSRIEAAHAWVESVTFQMCQDSKAKHLAGQIALLKAHCSEVMWKCVDDAQQVLGGRGITQSGMGAKVERIAAYAKLGAILGGSEEILRDLGVREMAKETSAVNANNRVLARM
ncbi:Acyl-CoA dehydrogenase [Pseudoscourfieldia marina]